MGPAGVNPGGAGGLEIGTAFPNRPGHRQLGQRVRRDDGIDFVHDQAESISQIDQRCVNRGSRRRIKHQSHGIGFAADSQGMNLQ